MRFRREPRLEQRFRFRAEAGHVAGLDIGVREVAALVADLDGVVVGRRSLLVSPSATPAERLGATKSALRDACAASGVLPEALWQVGVASTGFVDHSGRVTRSVALPTWAGTDIPAALADAVSCPVTVENDCRAAALAERWRGLGRGVDDMVYIHAGLRTGTSVIIGGELLRGHSGAAGEFGAIPRCGWAEAPMHLLAFPGLPETARAEWIAESVFSRAQSGDQDAIAATERFVRSLAEGVTALVLAFDPELVVLGGGFSRSCNMVLDRLVAELDRVCVRVPRVAASVLDCEWVVVGAVRVALDAVDARYFASDMALSLRLRT